MGQSQSTNIEKKHINQPRNHEYVSYQSDSPTDTLNWNDADIDQKLFSDEEDNHVITDINKKIMKLSNYSELSDNIDSEVNLDDLLKDTVSQEFNFNKDDTPFVSKESIDAIMKGGAIEDTPSDFVTDDDIDHAIDHDNNYETSTIGSLNIDQEPTPDTETIFGNKKSSYKSDTSSINNNLYVKSDTSNIDHDYKNLFVKGDTSTMDDDDKNYNYDSESSDDLDEYESPEPNKDITSSQTISSVHMSEISRNSTSFNDFKTYDFSATSSSPNNVSIEDPEKISDESIDTADIDYLFMSRSGRR